MTFKRNAIKNNFKTGDKPTEAQFAEFIDSGFNLHQYQYDSNYAYEEGNIVVVSETYTGGGGVTSPPKWFVYRRTDHMPETTGNPVEDGLFWKKIIGGINIFNEPTIVPGEDPIEAPFSIFYNQSQIGRTDVLTDDVLSYDQGTTLRFEDRSYNLPGKYKYTWKIYRNGNLIDTIYKRDIEYLFQNPGTYIIKLEVEEYGVSGFHTTEYTVEILSTGTCVDIEFTEALSLNPPTGNTQGVNTTFNAAINKSSNVELRLYEVDPTPTEGSNYVQRQYSVLKDWMLEDQNYVDLTSNLEGQTITKTFNALRISTQTPFELVAIYDDGQGCESEASSLATLNYSAAISITNLVLSPTKFYPSSHLVMNMVVDAEFNEIPSDVDYIRLRNTIANDNVFSLSGAVALGKISGEGLFTHELETPYFETASSYSLSLQYKDNIMTGYIESDIETINIQNPVEITHLQISETYSVTVKINKTPSIANGNEYQIWQNVNGGAWTEVTGFIEGVMENSRSFSFTTTLTIGSGDIYNLKIQENLGEEGNDAVSEDEDNVTYSPAPKLYWGILGEDFFENEGYSIRNSSLVAIGPLNVVNLNTLQITVSGDMRIYLDIGRQVFFHIIDEDNFGRTVSSFSYNDESNQTTIVFNSAIPDPGSFNYSYFVIHNVLTGTNTINQSTLDGILSNEKVTEYELAIPIVSPLIITFNSSSLISSLKTYLLEKFLFHFAYQFFACPVSSYVYTLFQEGVGDVLNIADYYFVIDRVIGGENYKIYIHRGSNPSSGMLGITPGMINTTYSTT
jgi:hypothetical protein